MKDASPHWPKVLMDTSKGSRLSSISLSMQEHGFLCGHPRVILFLLPFNLLVSTSSQLFQQPLAQPLAFCPPPLTPPHPHCPTPSLTFIPSLRLKQPLAGALVLHRRMSEDERYRKSQCKYFTHAYYLSD